MLPSEPPSSSAAGQGCQQPNIAEAAFVFGHRPRVHAAHSCVATLPARPTMDTPTACGDGEAPGGASSQGTQSSQGRKRTAADVQCQRVKRSRSSAADASACSTEPDECQEVVVVGDSGGDDAQAGALTQSAEPTELEDSTANHAVTSTRVLPSPVSICGVLLSDHGKSALLITEHGSRATRTYCPA